MAELDTTKLNPETHLLLEQPLLRMPHELSRKNFTIARREVDREQNYLTKTLASPPSSGSPSTTLDTMISRMTNLKRKLEALHAEEATLHAQSRARIEHLAALERIPSVVDVKYEAWSRVRLNRLLVDYLLRNGYEGSARQLSSEKGIEELVDVEAWGACAKVERALKAGRMSEALAWCADNGKELKKMNSTLQFELRLQQFIELIRAGKLLDATLHARKYLISAHSPSQAIKAAGLLAYPPDTDIEPYASLYSPARYTHLSTLFLKTHNTLFSIPSRPLLHIALAAGLSALKTPACHSIHTSSSANANSSTSTLCPICSKELHHLARSVPYAHHTKSHVDPDPVVLPNGRIYGRERLMVANEKMGTRKGRVRDPTNLDEEFDEAEVKKVFIS